jgi:hypothetical protein
MEFNFSKASKKKGGNTMLSKKEKEALHNKWDEFEKNQPEEIRCGKLLSGEELILKKTRIHGVSVYMSKVPWLKNFDESKVTKNPSFLKRLFHTFF